MQGRTPRERSTRMVARRLTGAALAAGLVTVGMLVGVSFGQQQEGLGERIGQGLDGVGKKIRRGAVEVTDSMRRGFENVRSDVQRMALPQRVYSRIHWDRALVDAR